MGILKKNWHDVNPFHTFNQEELPLGSLCLSTRLLYRLRSLGCSIGLGITFFLDRVFVSGEFSTFGGHNYNFQQDNDPKNISRATRDYLEWLGLDPESWISQSPDLNPIENLWSYLDWTLRQVLQEA